MAFMEHSLPKNYQLRKFFIDRQKKLRTEPNEQKISIFCSSSHLKSLFLQNVLIICTLRKFSRSKIHFWYKVKSHFIETFCMHVFLSIRNKYYQTDDTEKLCFRDCFTLWSSFQLLRRLIRGLKCLCLFRITMSKLFIFCLRFSLDRIKVNQFIIWGLF